MFRRRRRNRERLNSDAWEQHWRSLIEDKLREEGRDMGQFSNGDGGMSTVRKEYQDNNWQERRDNPMPNDWA